MTRRAWLSLGVAAGLSTLTLGVFAAAQSAGPESAVRRYFRAIQLRDPAGAQAVLTTPLQAPITVWLTQQSAPLATARFTVRAKERSGDIALVITEHNLPMDTPQGQQMVAFTRFWVLARDRGQWRIDPVRTYRYVEQSMMPGR